MNHIEIRVDAVEPFAGGRAIGSSGPYIRIQGGARGEQYSDSPADTGLTARLPAAIESGKPMIRRIRDEFHIGPRAPGEGDTVRLHYPAASTDKQRARLPVRARESDIRTEIGPEAWEFADRQTI